MKPIKQLPTQAEIRCRAFEIFLAHGGGLGHEIDDWLQAEYELVQLPVQHLAKLAAPQPKRPRLAVAEMVKVALLIGGWI